MSETLKNKISDLYYAKTPGEQARAYDDALDALDALAEKDREIERLKKKLNDSTVFEQLREQQAEIDTLKKELHRISSLYEDMVSDMH